MGNHGMTVAARIISMMWAGCWLGFGIVTGIVEQQGPVNFLLHTMTPGGLGLITVLIAFQWQGPGGFTLLAEGLILAFFLAMGGLNPATAVSAAFLVFTLVVPPLVSGLLFLGGMPESHTPQHV